MAKDYTNRHDLCDLRYVVYISGQQQERSYVYLQANKNEVRNVVTSTTSYKVLYPFLKQKQGDRFDVLRNLKHCQKMYSALPIYF